MRGALTGLRGGGCDFSGLERLNLPSVPAPAAEKGTPAAAEQKGPLLMRISKATSQHSLGGSKHGLNLSYHGISHHGLNNSYHGSSLGGSYHRVEFKPSAEVSNNAVNNGGNLRPQATTYSV